MSFLSQWVRHEVLAFLLVVALVVMILPFSTVRADHDAAGIDDFDVELTLEGNSATVVNVAFIAAGFGNATTTVTVSFADPVFATSTDATFSFLKSDETVLDLSDLLELVESDSGWVVYEQVDDKDIATTTVFVFTVTDGAEDVDLEAFGVKGEVELADADGASDGGHELVEVIDLGFDVDTVAPSAPIASPAAGTFSTVQNVSLSSSGSDFIRYTADGSTPTCSSGALYSSAVSVNSSQTINAIGCDDANNTPASASFVYTRQVSSGGGGGGGYLRPQASVTLPNSANNVQSILDLLRMFGESEAAIAKVQAILTGQTSAGVSPAGGAFTRDLGLGAEGEDVRALQQFLNARGFPVASSGPGAPGNETTLFGPLTQAALAAFQAANGISPAAGYFGPITRAFIVGM